MKKAYLSIASLLACITLASCNSGEVTSSNSTTPSESTTTSSESTTSSSVADVFTYKLELEAPSITTYEVGDVFDFASIVVKERTFKNGTVEGNAKTLARSEFVVKVNGQVIEGNFTFASAGEVEFLVASAAHSEATATFKLTAVQHYTLTNGSADKVVLTNLPEKALPGESITFGVTLLPGYYLENGVKVLNDAGEEIESHDNGDYTYTFTMPAGNVTITINTGITDFTISKDQELIGDILVEDSEDTTDTFSAVPGTKLKFQAQETVDTSFSAIYVDGVVVTKGEDDYYHFVMPHHPVVISAERVAREYSISASTSSLTLSTLKMYTNAETKAEVTNAHKGQTVYLEFATDKAHVKYFITIKTSDDDSLEVTPSTSSNVFTFVMVSSNITIEIQEEDYSKYYGYYVTDKAWKFTQFGSYSSASTDVLNYASFKKSLVFESNGSGDWNGASFTWTQEANATSGSIAAKVEDSYSTYDKKFYYTENLVVMNPSTYNSSSWYQAGVGTWNADTTIHALALDDGGTRLFYTVDENDAIKESIVINNSTVTVNPTIYKDDSKTTLAKGSELSLTTNFYVSLSAETGFDITNGKVKKAYTLGVGEGSSEQITIVYKNANGETITKAKNGDAVTVILTLSEEATAAGLSIDTPSIAVDDRYTSATLTPVEGEANTYTFVMPTANVTVKALTFNPNLYEGYAVIGKYAGFELYGSTTTKDITNYSSAYGKFTREITKAGKFVSPTSTRKPGNVTEITNSTKGTFIVSDDLDESHFNKKWFFGNGTMATYWSDSETSHNLTDTYVAVRVPSDFDPSTLTTKIHWIDGGSSWALEFYVSNVLAGGIFATNTAFYCGATFEMTGESTRIGKDATYTVKLDGQAIFTVANETVTAAE